MQVNTGIAEQARTELAKGLSRVLAGTYTLYLKTQNYHWNVTGPLFPQLHAQFETQYTELQGAVDAIAERIRALGARAPGSYSEFAELSSVKEANGARSAQQMLADLLASHEQVVQDVRAVHRTADQHGDDATANLLDDRLSEHEKHAWMLRASLEDGGSAA